MVELLSLVGDGILLIALPLYVYNETGSILATGILFVMGTAPVALLGAVAGVYVDRWSGKRTLIACHVVLSAVVAALVFAPWLGALWPIYVVSLVHAAVMHLVRISADTLMPALVERERLTSANAFLLSGRNAAELIGPAMSGVVMAVMGFHAVVFLTTAIYASAIIALSFMAVPATPRSPVVARAGGEAMPAWAAELLAGVRLVKENRVGALLLGIYALCSLGEGAFSVLFVPFVTEVLRGGELAVGTLFSVQAVGGILGGVIFGRFGHRFSASTMLAFGALLLGAVDLLFINSAFVASSLLPAYVLMALAGIPAVAFGAGFRALIQENVQSAYLGRVFGLMTAVSALFMLLGAAFAGIFGEVLGVVPVIHLQVIVYVLAGVIVLICRNRVQA